LGFGFVKFQQEASAAQAISLLNGNTSRFGLIFTNFFFYRVSSGKQIENKRLKVRYVNNNFFPRENNRSIFIFR